jgi:hypothetical protein
MGSLQDYITFQVMLLQILLNYLQGLPVSTAEAGASHADLYLFSCQCHLIVFKVNKITLADPNLYSLQIDYCFSNNKHNEYL